MTELSNLGKVVTTDVLIVGAGVGGVTTALKLKQLDPSIDILCLEKGYYGRNGQTSKAGHGIYHMAEDDDIDVFAKTMVETNNMGGLYLNDQEYMYKLAERGYTYLAELEELGAVFSHNEDDSFHHHREFPTKPSSASNVDLDFSEPLQQMALKKGVRVLERFYFTDLLKDGDRVVGAVGFHKDTLEFYIIRAKAVVLATNAFNPVVTGMFFSPATGVISAWEAGAQLRNAEQAMYCELCYRNTKNFMYGVHWVIHNSKGENLFIKYGSQDFENIDLALIRGMIKEVNEGNFPLYVDFTKLPDTSETEGEGFNMGILMKERLAMDEVIRRENPAMASPLPEISLCTYIYSHPLRADENAKTTVPGLWAIGQITQYGASNGSWVHGEGIGYALRTALWGAESIHADLGELSLGEVDVDQVLAFKERIYEPFEYKGTRLPYEVTHYLDTYICQFENSINKTEESIHAVLENLAELRETYKSQIYVPEGDGHHLMRAFEVRTAIDLLEIMYMAYDARKESRGTHMRADYPERDDANWLKWICFDRGEDGRPVQSFERIPFERYKWKPEGWTE